MAKLITQSQMAKLIDAGTDGKVAILKLFGGQCTWVVFGAVVADTIYAKDDLIMDALCDIGHDCCERGDVSLGELMSVKAPLFVLQRDRFFSGEGKDEQHFRDFYDKRGTLAGC